MDDELVRDVMNDLEGLAFANGLSASQYRPCIDAMVNRLRTSGMSDLSIRQLLLPEPQENSDAQN